LLAYYFAYLSLVAERTTSTFCPIVVDSPRQQDIDPENWRRMLQFIESRRPSQSQMILSLVDTGGVKLSGKIFELTEKKSAMQREQYEDVAQELTPLVDVLLGL
jgi:hypothetical protein